MTEKEQKKREREGEQEGVKRRWNNMSSARE